MRSRRLLGLIDCLLAACLLLLAPASGSVRAVAQGPAAPGLDTTTPLVNPSTGWLLDGSALHPRGAYVPLPARTTAFADGAPSYSMVMDTVTWADLQPASADSFDFREIDDVIAYWKPFGKKVLVKLIATDDPGWRGPGRDVRPGWLIADPSLTWKSYSYGGYAHVEPDYLDAAHFPSFMARWTNLVEHVAAHYAGSKDVVGFLVGWGNWGEGGNTTASGTDLGTARQTISAGFVSAAKNAFASAGVPVLTYAFYAGAGTLTYANQSHALAFDTGPDALEGIASGGYLGGTSDFRQTPQWDWAIGSHWYRFQNFGEANYTPDDGSLWTTAIADDGYASQFGSAHVDYAQLWLDSGFYNDPAVNGATLKANIAAGLVGGGLGCRLAVSAADLGGGVLHLTFVNQNSGTCFQSPPVYVYVHSVATRMAPSVAGKDLSKLVRSTSDCGDPGHCATSVSYEIPTAALPAFAAGDHAYVAVGDEDVGDRLWLGNLRPTDAAGTPITTGLGTDVSKRAVVRYDLGPLGAAAGDDTTPPSVALTQPAPDATVSGTSVALAATASDDVGVASVQFRLDGAAIGAPLTSAPYTYSWDSTATANGAHTLTAIASDAAANQATAAPVAITVSNAAAPAIAFVRALGTNSVVNSGSTITLSVPAPGVAAGDTVVVWAGTSGSNTIGSITDSRGDAYTVDSTVSNTSGSLATFVGSAYAPSGLPAGSTITVTLASGYYSIRVLAAAEFRGVEPSGRIDRIASGAGSSASPASAATATTRQADELVVAGFGAASLATFTPAAGFTALPSIGTTGSGVSRSIHQAYRIVHATGQYSAAGTLSAGTFWTAAVATYRGGGGGGGDTTPPTVALTAPAAGATVSGTVTVSAAASDDVGVTGVQMTLDGASLGAEDVTAPYAVAWDTTTSANGTHTLAAVARDAAGNTTSATAVTVTVANAVSGVPTPVPAASVAGVTVGGGFVEASARQVLRTPANVVYVVTADDNPCQNGGSGAIRVAKGIGAQPGNPAVPASFAEQDAAHHPVSAASGSCLYSSATSVLFSPDSRLDRNGIVHTAYIDTANGNVYYQTFSTLTDTWGPRTAVATGALRSSGSGWPRSGQVALTLDANDLPHTVYATAGSANSLRATALAGGTWSTPATVVSGTDLMHPTLVTALDGSLQLAWLGSSLASHATIGYARLDGSTWSAPELVSAGDNVVLANSDDDQGPSIATDLQSRPHVLFLDGTVNGGDNYVRMRVRTAAGSWIDDTPPGGAGGSSNPAGTWYAHTPQNYVSANGDDLVFLGHDVNISPGGYEFRKAGSAWSPYATLDPRNATNTPEGEPGIDGSASIRFDPLRDANPGIVDLVYYDESDGTAGYSRHATVYYKAVVVGVTPDTSPPTAPTGLAQVGSTGTSVALGWNASSDDVAVAGYGLYNGPSRVGSTPITTGTIAGLTCGTTYTVGVDAFDFAGNRSAETTTSATTAACDTQPPTVAVTAPADGATVGGVVPVTAAATDDVGVAGVQFRLDGAPLGTEDTAAPYAFSWDTSASTTGTHVLSAVARDAAGNATTSAPVTVTVARQGPAFVKDLGSATALGGGGSLQLTVPAGGVAAGQTIVVWAGMSGGSSVRISSIADSRGNAYTADAAIGNQGVNTMIGSGYVATALAQGDRITVTFSGSYYSVRLVRAAAFSGLSASGRLDRTATGTGRSTTPATALAPATSQAAELLVGAVGTDTSATLTAGGGFTALPAATKSGSGVTRTLTPLFRIVAATGQYQAAGTLSATSFWSAALATYR